MTIDRPQASEFNEYYLRYVDKVPASGPVAALKEQLAGFEKIRALPESDGDRRYGDGKWSVKEVIGHMADTERLFAYRLLHIARGDAAALPGMDQEVWNASAPHAKRRLADVVDEMIAVRRSTMALVESLDADAVGRAGVASGFPVSARALVWILPGHAQHHLDVLADRYGV